MRVKLLLLMMLVACPVWAVITQTGATADYNIAATATGTVSSTITVPADAQIVVVGISSYYSAGGGNFSGGSMTFTKGSVDTAMTAVTGGDASTTAYNCAMFYLVSPDTGSNKSLKWAWVDTATNDPLVSVAFFKGINTADAIRDSDGGQNTSLPYTTPTLTASSGDLIVAFVAGFAATEGSITTWSNLSELSECVYNPEGSSDGAWATGAPSGNTTVAASTGDAFGDGGICAVVLKPAEAGAPAQHNNMLLLGVGSMFAQLVRKRGNSKTRIRDR